jgi:DNA-binding GntR family transcriptional regulator
MNKPKTAPQRTPKRTAKVLSAAPVPTPQTPADEDNSDRTLAERAFRLLRNDILNGRLAPDARLRINLLQQRYGLGLSPLREALLRLSSEGLVVAQGQRGFAVAPVSLAELQDQTVARKCLDIAALKQSMEQGDADWEAQVMAANHLLARTPLPTDANDITAARLWEERHRAFHRALIAGCGSQWLMRLHNQLVDQIERYRTMRILHHHEAAAQVRDVVAEHAAITNAVLGREVAKAAELMDRHISATAEAMRQFFEQDKRKSRAA